MQTTSHEKTAKRAEKTQNDFATIYVQYINKIYNFAFRMTGSREVAEDITQETFEKAFTNLDKFRGGSDLFTWIYSIARNTCYQHFKKTKKSSFNSFETLIERESSSEKNNQYDELEKQFYINQVKNGCLLGLLRCLSFYQRISFVLNVFNDIPVKEISNIINKSDNSTRILIHRAKANIKAFLCKNCSLYEKTKKCKCENLVSFSLRQGWIEKYHPEVSPETVEREMKLFKNEIQLYKTIPSHNIEERLTTKIRNFIDIAPFSIFFDKKMK